MQYRDKLSQASVQAMKRYGTKVKMIDLSSSFTILYYDGSALYGITSE